MLDAKTLREPIRIVILDTKNLFRAGLRLILETQPDFQVVGEAGDLQKALSLCQASNPDIILIEHDPESGFDLSVFREISSACSQAYMILVTASNDRQVFLEAIKQNVLGIVTRNQTSEILFRAIRTVHAGEVWFDHAIMTDLVHNSSNHPGGNGADQDGSKGSQLGPREIQIIELIKKARKNKEIAAELCIAETTVRHHLTSIYRKLGISSRLELLLLENNRHPPLETSQGERDAAN